MIPILALTFFGVALIAKDSWKSFALGMSFAFSISYTLTVLMPNVQ